MYPLYELANYISLENIPSSWQNCYEDIKKKYHSDWLNKYDFKLILSYYGFDKDFKKRLEKELKILKQDNRLNVICFIMYYILFFAEKKDYSNIWSWKSTKKIFKNNGSYMIPVVSLLCGCPFHIENMKKKNFDKNQIEIQKYNIRLTCTNDHLRYKIDGIRFSQMIWGSLFMKGHLIQIGRLQYEFGVKNLDKLDKYFKEKHQYIYIHIPRGEKLTEKDVDDSLSLVNQYIKTYYPELENEKLAYYTQTWLLSPEVKEILPENSNIIKFQKKFNIIEQKENMDDFLKFVFGVVLETVDYHNLPEKTTLQKELKKKLLNGDNLHLGSGFLKDAYDNNY